MASHDETAAETAGAFAAMDRASIASHLFDDHLLNHEFVQAHPELRKQAESISDALGDFYQQCAGVWNDLEEARASG